MRIKNKYIILTSALIITGSILVFSLMKKKESEKNNTLLSPCGIALPKPTGYVNDFVHLFTPDQFAVLDSIIGNHEKETTNQIAIITFDSSMMGKCTLEQFTMVIGNEWGVGQKEKNNGVIIGIVPSLRKMRIENGYGIEKIITDIETKLIIDSFFLPSFKNAEYFEGTRNGLLALIEKIK